MPIRGSLIGFAGLLLACSGSSGGGGDVSSGWFAVASKQGLLSVSRKGNYEFQHHPTPSSIQLAAGQLEPSMLEQLEGLLTGELRRHYYANRTTDEQRCRDEGGYSLVHGGGCWIVDEVTDDKTKSMLDVLVPLYKEKENEAITKPTATGAAGAPGTPVTASGTPHI